MLRRASPPPDPATIHIERLVVASEGRPVAWPVLQQAFELARPAGAAVHVVSIARVWGTAMGFPNPWLNPTRKEWDAQRLQVREACEALRKAGFDASAQVIGTRKAAKRIVGEAQRFRADAIVMGADPKRTIVGDFLWSQEPYRVARRAPIPVYLVPVDPSGGAENGPGRAR
jgi:nucleotide-binding universal stress UspA family protein